jgi:hypothetical protein
LPGCRWTDDVTVHNILRLPCQTFRDRPVEWTARKTNSLIVFSLTPVEFQGLVIIIASLAVAVSRLPENN